MKPGRLLVWFWESRQMHYKPPRLISLRSEPASEASISAPRQGVYTQLRRETCLALCVCSCPGGDLIREAIVASNQRRCFCQVRNVDHFTPSHSSRHALHSWHPCCGSYVECQSIRYAHAQNLRSRDKQARTSEKHFTITYHRCNG